MTDKGMPERIWVGEGSGFEGQDILIADTEDWNNECMGYIRADIVEELVRLAAERDGGAHDPDCKIGNVWSNMPICNCGHVALTDILSRISAIMEGRSRGPNGAQWYRGNEPWCGPEAATEGK